MRFHVRKMCKPGNGRPYLGIAYRRLKQFLEVLVPFLFLIASFPPLGNGLSVEDQDVEESVKEQDDIGFDGYTVQKDGLWGNVERV